MKNVMITGAGPNGFIGRNLKEALQDKYCIFAPPRLELNLLDQVELAAYIEKHAIQVIIHGAIHVPRFNGSDDEMESDMLMFYNVESMHKYVEKIIYFGSGAEYDKRFDISNVTEEDIGTSIPISSYGLSKYTMNRLVQCTDNIYNLRLFGVYGKYELWDVKFISNLCCKALYDMPLTIRQNCIFDFLYIDDLVQIVTWFIENKPQYKDYNVCSGIPITLEEIAVLVKKVSKKELPIHILKDGWALDYTGNNSRLCQEMKAFKWTSMEEGILALYRYYKEHKEKIDREILRQTR